MRFSFLVLYHDMSIFNNIRLAFRYFYQKRSHFPQTVEVAVGVDRLDLIALAESEADLRLFAGMQFLTLIALLAIIPRAILKFTQKTIKGKLLKKEKENYHGAEVLHLQALWQHHCQS